MFGAASGGAGAGAVVRQGHLRKLKTMKKKYFVLRAEASDGARLEYYESEKKFRSGAAPRRVLPLKSCYDITRRLDLKQKHVIALFTREEQFCVVAENEKELHDWLTAILKQHGSDDASEELLHPIQHVWQVNVQKKGLGASKNIQGLYNLCLTDKTLTLVKIKSHNNVIRELAIPERIEYSLKNIRRCGDSECFFYMEVGRQTSTGAGELWMHSDDSNIAQSMHSTIYLAMKNCTKDDERDHIPLPKNRSLEGSNPPRDRSQSMYSDSKKSRPGLANDAGPRSRCESMPSYPRASAPFETDKPPARLADLADGLETSRDEPDALAEWYRTPRIPEEPDCCDAAKDFIGMGRTATSSLSGPLPAVQHSRTSSLGVEDEARAGGYLPMAPHEPSGLVSASSGSVCSGTPSTDPRFSEYQLEPATSHISSGERPPRAYSVGSRPSRAEPPRHRAYSVGAQHARPAPRPQPASAPLLPRASAEDLMELDFSANSNNSQLARSSLASLAYTPVGHRSGSPSAKVVVARTPPTSIGFSERRGVDEYVDMSPRNHGYVEMRPGEPALPSLPTLPTLPTPAAVLATPTTSAPAVATKDGYVEMNYTRAPTKPIAITQSIPPPAPSVAAAAVAPPPAAGPRRPPPPSPPRTPLGSQTLFPLSLDSPASPAEVDDRDIFDEDMPEPQQHPLSTVREISEEGRRSPSPPPAVSMSPQYVVLARGRPSRPIAAPAPQPAPADLPGNPTANKTLARLPSTAQPAPEASGTATLVVAASSAAPARFVVCGSPSPPASPPAPPSPPSPTATHPTSPLNYAALDLEPRRGPAAAPLRTYTQIDFVRSEKLAADGT